MGYYINKIGENFLPAKGKAEMLLENGGTKVDGKNFQENLICVVDNGPFEAAAYCYNQNEYEEFARNDGRSKVWLTHPDAATLSGF